MEMDFPVESLNLFEGEPTTHRKMKSGNHKHGCPDLKFTQQQKKMYQEVQRVFEQQMFETKKSHIQMKKKYFSQLRVKNPQNEMLTQLQNQLTKIRTELEEARADFFHFIFFEVATANQRRPLLKCLNHMRHHRRVRELRIDEKKHRDFHKQTVNKTQRQ
jgi:hypothetical protein